MSILHHIALIYSTFINININIVIVFEIKWALFTIYKIYFLIRRTPWPENDYTKKNILLLNCEKKKLKWNA